MNHFSHAAAAVALFAAAASPAAAQGFNLDRSLADITYYGTLGRSDVGYSDNGTGLKVGASTSVVLPQYSWLGATTYYAYTSGGHNYSALGCGNWRLRNHSVAVGPTATLPVGGGFSLEGRVVLSANVWNISAGCSTYNSSGTQVDAGAGGSLHYRFSSSLGLRADIDKIGWRSTLVSFGLNVKY